MVKPTQNLDWQSVDVVLLWKVPKTIKKTADIYLKLWGMIQTINTTTQELQQRLHDGTNDVQRQQIEQLLIEKKSHYPSDDFPLIAFHPTHRSYHALKLKTDIPFFLTLVFGGEHSHHAQAWFDWFRQRLTLENTGFTLLELWTWHTHQKTLPAISTLQNVPINNSYDGHYNPLLEQNILIDMPANLNPNNKIAKNPNDSNHSNESSAITRQRTLIAHIQKRLKQWFPTQNTLIDR